MSTRKIALGAIALCLALGIFAPQAGAVAPAWSLTATPMPASYTPGHFSQFVVVATNVGSTVFENGATANNSAVGATPLIVTVQPRPDLQVSKIVAPASVPTSPAPARSSAARRAAAPPAMAIAAPRFSSVAARPMARASATSIRDSTRKSARSA